MDHAAPPLPVRRRLRLRLLPLTIFGASLLLTVKLGALLTPGTPADEAISVTQSRAQQAQQGKTAPTSLTPQATATNSGAPPSAVPSKPAPPAAAATAQPQPAAEQPASQPAVPASPPSVTGKARDAQVDPVTMSQTEIDVLQALGERRRQLDERERAIEQREALMQAAEKRIAEKVNELKAIQAKLETSLKKQETEREEQLRRLVKVYESMKPKEAARIFEQLDDAVLIDVAERMKEVKLAPVLASMEPKKATLVTTELAKRRQARPSGSLPTGG
jgi:flagellar motility protein MotE (MotC chaperone)